MDDKTNARLQEVRNAVVLENLVKAQENFTAELQKTNDKIQDLTEAVINQKLMEAELNNVSKRVTSLESTRWFVLTICFATIIGAVLKVVLKV